MFTRISDFDIAYIDLKGTFSFPYNESSREVTEGHIHTIET